MLARSLNPASRIAAAVLLAATFAAVPSCKSKQSTKVRAEQPVGPAGYTPSQITAKIKIFGDSMVSLISQASDELVAAVETPELRAAAQGQKLAMGHAIFSIAASRSSMAAVLDMTVFASLQLHAVEQYWNPVVFGGRAESLVAALTTANETIWALVQDIFEPASIEGLHELIDRWIQDHPTQWYVTHIRFADFTEYRSMTVTAERGGGPNLFSLFMIDPLAGLDPTMREIEQTRQLAERLFYYLGRVQILISWQVQGLAFDMTALPESQQLLAELQQYGEVAERFAAIAEGMPQELQAIVAEERAAAIEQMDGVITAQREGLMQDIESQGPVVQDVLAGLQQTLDAGTALSTSVHSTLETINAMGSDTPAEPRPASTSPSEPFDIKDYGAVASKTTETARELNELVNSLDNLLGSPALEARLGELDLAVARAESSGKRLLNHTFLLAAGLVALVLVASLIKIAVTRNPVKAPGASSER